MAATLASLIENRYGRTQVPIEVVMADGAVMRGDLLLQPVVPREIWLLPHSHVDIGVPPLEAEQAIIADRPPRRHRVGLKRPERTCG